MAWGFAALIVSALIYGGFIVLQYILHAVHVHPRLSRLEDEAKRLSLAVDMEEVLEVELKARIGEMRRDLEAIQRKIVGLQSGLRDERERQQRLEMMWIKERLRHGRLTGVSSVRRSRERGLASCS